MSASEMAAKVVPDTLMIVSYVSQYHEVFKNETPGNMRGISEFKKLRGELRGKRHIEIELWVKSLAIILCWSRCKK